MDSWMSSSWRRPTSPRTRPPGAAIRSRTSVPARLRCRSTSPISTGCPQSEASNPALYTGTNWTNAARLTELAARNPNPGGAAANLWGNATFRTNMVAAAYPRNFFVMNPDVNNANVTTNGNTTKYDSLQLTWRRSLSDGLAVDANYVLARRYASTLDTLREERPLVRSTQGVPQALKLTAIYDLPFGRGRRYGADVNGLVDAVIGGWALNLAARVQSGTVVNFGNVRLVGMSEDEFQDAFKVRIDPANPNNVWMLPQEIIDNTIRAFSVSATSATGYGALGPPTGRYLAPANGPDCIQQVRGDCAPHDVFVDGAGVHAIRSQRQKAVRAVWQKEHRVRGGRVEPVQRDQLQPGRHLAAPIRTTTG